MNDYGNDFPGKKGYRRIYNGKKSQARTWGGGIRPRAIQRILLRPVKHVSLLDEAMKNGRTQIFIKSVSRRRKREKGRGRRRTKKGQALNYRMLDLSFFAY